MKLSKDAGVKARIGTSISSLMKQKHVMVSQVMGIYEILDKDKKKNRTDHRYNWNLILWSLDVSPVIKNYYHIGCGVMQAVEWNIKIKIKNFRKPFFVAE